MAQQALNLDHPCYAFGFFQGHNLGKAELEASFWGYLLNILGMIFAIDIKIH